MEWDSSIDSKKIDSGIVVVRGFICVLIVWILLSRHKVSNPALEAKGGVLSWWDLII